MTTVKKTAAESPIKSPLTTAHPNREILAFDSVIFLTAVKTGMEYPRFNTTRGVVEMASEQWARLRRDKACRLRLGAWYRVARANADIVVVAVGRGEIPVSRDGMEVLATRPSVWSVVDRRAGSRSLSARWGTCYTVCPNCRQRQLPLGRPKTQRCEKCNQVFEVAWDEPVFGGNFRLV